MTPLTTSVLLALICVLSFAIRLFPVVIWGSVRVSSFSQPSQHSSNRCFPFYSPGYP